MATRRKIVTIMPVEAMVGKLQAINKEGQRFYVGFQRKYSVKNMFQARMRAISVAPTSEQLAGRQKFTVSVREVETQMQDVAHAQVLLRKFKAQTKYSTQRGFAVAEAYKYYDESTQTVVWPADYWTA